MANKKETIILVVKADQKRVFTTLTKCCKIMGYKYNTLCRKEFPFDHGGYVFFKLPVENELVIKTENNG
jgi:hypothetical protein